MGNDEATRAGRMARVGYSTLRPAEGSSDKVFELGVVMAGAISAGAYTAGVIDFLVEALDEFEQMKATGRDDTEPYDGPRHTVMIPVMAGASAGGMTAAIAALQLFHALEHVSPGGEPKQGRDNRLYSSWVKDVDLEKMLLQTDLDALDEGGSVAVVKSVLCCDVLDRIVDRAFDLGPPKVRRWVGGRFEEPLKVFVTVSNVSGVPYRFKMHGTGTVGDSYGMLDHGDRIAFTVSAAPVATESVYGVHLDVTGRPRPAPVPGKPQEEPRIDWADAAWRDGVWDLFRRSALATGAFPVGLAPRVVWRERVDYFSHAKYHVTDEAGNVTPVDPPFGKTTGRYRFPTLDGGTIDNEPLELARHHLAARVAPGVTRSDDPHNPRDGEMADRAVILIDPFPNVVDDPPSQDGADRDFGLLATLKSLLPMLVDQARFKPEELQLSRDDTVFSRFNVTPSRTSPCEKAKRYPIASGALGGFSGFLSESYRRHDYLLGRRNAQAFLRWHLVLPRTNPIFVDADGRFDPASPTWWVVDDRPESAALAPRRDGAPAYRMVSLRAGDRDETSKVEALPIVPLSKRLLEKIEIGPRDQPWDLSAIGIAVERANAFEDRFRRIARRLLEKEVAGYLPWLLSTSGWARNIAAGFLATAARKKFEEVVCAAIDDVHDAFHCPQPPPEV